MKPIFLSKFEGVTAATAREVAEMVSSGSSLYLDFLRKIKSLSLLGDDYTSIPDLFKHLSIEPFSPLSKRKFYEKYTSGVVAGAGAGDDCIDLISEPLHWFLCDLEDTRMRLCALGYDNGHAYSNLTSTPEGSSIAYIKSKHCASREPINVLTIDSFELDFCGVISIDTEGTALDVLAGAVRTINDYKPDLLVSIYHNWIEYLLVIPFLYDMGYTINVVLANNPTPQQIHLELCVLATWDRER